MDKTYLFKSFPKQDEFFGDIFGCKYNFILYGGAIRGGKTFAGLMAIQLLSQIYPKSRWAVVRKDLPTLKRNTIPSWNKLKLTNIIKSENNSEYTVTFKNGSQIIFFPESFDTDKELERWRGLEVNGFLFEEIQECQYKSLMKAFERAGSNFITPMPTPLIMATCNPTQNWVKKEIYDKWKNGTLPARWKYIQSTIHDNPFIPPQYMDSLENMGYYERRVFVDGDWEFNLKQGGEFWKSFDLSKHVGQVNYQPNKPIHVVFDNNVAPYVSIQLWQIDEQRKELRQFGEIPCAYPDNSAIRAGQKLLRYLDSLDYKETLFIYGDSSSNAKSTIDEHGRSFYTLFEDQMKQRYKITNRVGKSNPSVSLSGQFVNEIFDNKMEWLITIDEGCKTSIGDYIDTKEDKNGGVLKTRITVDGQSFEKNGHMTDCMRYFVTSILDKEYRKFIGKGSLSAGAVSGW
jgi:hypothetical protein